MVAAATARGSGCGNANCRNWPTSSASTSWSATPAFAGAGSAARHQQVEQDRAPALLLHQPELARPAARQLSGDPRIKSGTELISATTTKTGLTVRCELDTDQYPNGIAVSDAEMAAINIKCAE